MANRGFISQPSFWQSSTTHEQILLVIFVLLKVALLWRLPLTGDEAYFITWGQEVALGYYDHPPAVGWVLYGLSFISDHLIVYRSFAFLASGLIAYLLYKTLTLYADSDKQHAFYVALVFFVSPISLMFVLTANDTVLVFFGIVGFYFFAKTLTERHLSSAIFAGCFLGLAFLSKYFAVFMLFGLLLYSIAYYRQIGFQRLSLMVLIVLVFVAENLYFNATHCWNNILFNFFSRTHDSHFQWENVVLYLLMLLFMLSPLGLYFLFKVRNIKLPGLVKLVLYAALPLLLALLLVSFGNQIGLHWPLISVSLLYLVYSLLSRKQLKKLYLFNAYSALLIGVGLLVATLFIDDLVKPSQRPQVALYTQTSALCAQLPDTTFFTLDYSSQSVLAYYCRNDDIHVFASLSKYGREDDKNTNFKSLDQQDLMILVTQQKDINKVAPFFKQLTVKELPLGDATYYWLEGRQFMYAEYREKILKPVNEAFYSAPDWFPKFPCPFKKQYDF